MLEHDEGAQEILGALGALLRERGHHFEIVVIGGTALLLSGLHGRATKDVDILALRSGNDLVDATELPSELVLASEEVGRIYGLAPDWFNPDPSNQLAEGLPGGFVRRLQRFDFGGLVVHVPDRLDQIALKVHAAADPSLPNKHMDDLRIMNPTEDELLTASDFALSQRGRRNVRARVSRVIEELRR